MRVAVILPSRGLIFSQTAEELLENLEGFSHEIFFSHKRPIPECFNVPLERALEGTFTHFWIVEEDMILPKNTLKTLLSEIKRGGAVACDYPLTKDGKPAAFTDPDGNAIYIGTGCMLLTRKFLEGFERPIFRTDTMWDLSITDVVEVSPKPATPNQYGLHDVTFGLQAYLSGKPIKVSKVLCGQRKLIQLGSASTNQGQHLIEAWTAITPNEPLPKLSETNRNVTLKDGTIALMDIKRAKKLAKEGKVSIPPLTYVRQT